MGEKIENIIREFCQSRDTKTYSGYFLKNTKELPLLVEISTNEQKGKIAEYGSWLCIHIAEKSPGVFNKYIPILLDAIQQSSNQTLLRNWLKVITLSEWKSELDGQLLNLSFTIIENSSNKVALQVNAIKILEIIVLREPDILPEVLDLIDLHAQNKTIYYHKTVDNFIRKHSKKK